MVEVKMMVTVEAEVDMVEAEVEAEVTGMEEAKVIGMVEAEVTGMEEVEVMVMEEVEVTGMREVEVDMAEEEGMVEDVVGWVMVVVQGVVLITKTKPKLSHFPVT
uniref:Uncharacterized protein n=1 Tax=Noccaea caerulescens TaxID=107243 RepID=A0A1J3D5N9_NOCCA